jgi:hypothetical protein
MAEPAGALTTPRKRDASEEAAPTVNLYRGALQARGLNIIA